MKQLKLIAVILIGVLSVQALADQHQDRLARTEIISLMRDYYYSGELDILIPVFTQAQLGARECQSLKGYIKIPEPVEILKIRIKNLSRTQAEEDKSVEEVIYQNYDRATAAELIKLIHGSELGQSQINSLKKYAEFEEAAIFRQRIHNLEYSHLKQQQIELLKRIDAVNSEGCREIVEKTRQNARTFDEGKSTRYVYRLSEKQIADANFTAMHYDFSNLPDSALAVLRNQGVKIRDNKGNTDIAWVMRETWKSKGYIIGWSNYYGILWPTTAGIICRESNGNPSTKSSPKGARGIMQIRPPTAGDVSGYLAQEGCYVDKEDILSGYELNIRAGVKYIEHYIIPTLKRLQRPVTPANVFVAYNAGAGTVGKILPRETFEYEKFVETFRMLWFILDGIYGTENIGAALGEIT